MEVKYVGTLYLVLKIFWRYKGISKDFVAKYATYFLNPIDKNDTAGCVENKMCTIMTCLFS